MHFALSDGPPTMLAMMSAGSNKLANDHQRSVLDRDTRCIISPDKSHKCPMALCFKSHCKLTLIAFVTNPRVTSSARLATTLTRMLSRGQRR
jgi:hypothetical protein